LAKRGRPAREQADGGIVSSGRQDGDAANASAGGEHPNGSPQADALGDFAEDLGRFLGGVQNRASTWLDQRRAIAEQLTQIRDTANQYLQQLGTEGAHLMQRFEKARRGRPPGNKKATRAAAAGSPAPEVAVQDEARPKRTMSAEARARIAAAQRKRWAKVRRGTRNANR